MTVKDLRELLSAFPENARVFVKGYEGDWNDALPPCAGRIALNQGSGGYCGDHAEWDADDEKWQREWAKELEEPDPEVINAVLLPRS